MKGRLEFKILGAGYVILVVGVVAASLLVFSFVRDDIFSLARERLKATSQVITRSIERTMVEGKSDVTKSLKNDLKMISGFEEILVLNHEGREAFNPGSRVVEAAALKELRMTTKPIFVWQGDNMVFYSPLRNRAECHACHNESLPINGAVKVSVSMQNEQEKLSSFMAWMILGGILGTGVLGVVFWLIMRRFVTGPLQVLEGRALEMAQGDLTFNTGITSNDEIGILNGAIREALRSVSVVLQRVKEISGRISALSVSVGKESSGILDGTQITSEALSNISSSVEQLNAAITEIAEGTGSLASSVEGTAVSIEDMAKNIGSVSRVTNDLSAGVEATSSSIEQMSATIKEVAGNAEDLEAVTDDTMTAVEEILSSIKEVELSAKDSASLSEKVANDAATLGVSSIEKNMAGMQKIKKAVEKTALTIKKLGGRSEEIGKILNVIEDITDQTTLLALNAAILAAQAREHGKGFSVVAEEMRDLADRTAFSTQEIASLIQAVRQEVKDAVDSMEAGMSSVDEGLELSTAAGDALKKILQSSRQSSVMAKNIEKSTAEQARSARLVSESTEKVRGMVGQIAKATSEQSRGISLIIGATERMAEASSQVRTSSEHQAASSGEITQAVEIISEKSQQISRAIYEQKIGSDQIRDSLDKIKNIPEMNRTLASKINRALEELSKDSDLLLTEMRRFDLFEEEAGHVIRFGVVPLESPADMFNKFMPLTQYLGRKLQKRFDLAVATDFEAAVKDLGHGNTQYCFMSPSTYTEAHMKFGAKLVAKAQRDGKSFHHSVIVARKDSGLKSVKDLRDRSFAFGDKHSTSSHIVPRAMLMQEGIDLKDLASYNYLGHHDDVVKAVLNGDFDAGGVMEATAEKYRGQGLLFIEVSEEIPEFCICAGPLAGEEEKEALEAALLEIGQSTSEDLPALKAIDKNYTAFVRATDDDYSAIKLMMSKLGMI